MPEDGIHLTTFSDAEFAVPAVSAPSARCLRCAADLSRMPDEGRYCPRCGLDSYSSPPAAILSRAAESRLAGQSDGLGWNHLAELAVSSTVVVPPTVIPSPNTSSQIVLAYANALYKLGRRYEVGGWTRNPREAIRCYLKAARLGNMMAFARLATRWIERSDQMAKPPSADISPARNADDRIS